MPHIFTSSHQKLLCLAAWPTGPSLTHWTQHAPCVREGLFSFKSVQKHESKPQLEAPSDLLEGLLYKRQGSFKCWGGREEKEQLCTVGENVNWCSHCRKQYGGTQEIQNCFKIIVEQPPISFNIFYHGHKATQNLVRASVQTERNLHVWAQRMEQGSLDSDSRGIKESQILKLWRRRNFLSDCRHGHPKSTNLNCFFSLSDIEQLGSGHECYIPPMQEVWDRAGYIQPVLSGKRKLGASRETESTQDTADKGKVLQSDPIKLIINASAHPQISCMNLIVCTITGFPGGSEGKESACYAEDSGLIPRLGRFPWRREGQLTPVFLPGEFHGQRSLGGL